LKVLHFDCFSGISGDMALGALVDAGLDYRAWTAELEKLGLPGYTVSRKRVSRCGISGTKLSVKAAHGQPFRNLADIEKLINRSKITKAAKLNSLKIFRRLGEAEARVHGVPIEKVHFHEVGAVDSIVDIAGTAIALDMMGIGRVTASALNLGSGQVKFSHGTFPVPAPATAELVKGFPAYMSETKAELTTPTGAAIVTAIASDFGPMPAMTVSKTGCGAGGKDFPETPNLLRVFIGEDGEGGYVRDTVNLIETNIDDMDPRVYGHVMDMLFEAGAKDVWITPILMKKSRPAVTLSVLSGYGTTPAMVDIIMAETTTFGVRVSSVSRHMLERAFEEVETRHGKVRVKVGSAGGRVLKAVPEYEDVKALAEKSGKGIIGIIREAEGASVKH